MGFDWETLEGRYRIQLHKRVLKRTLATLQNKNILDVGAKTGYWTEWLTQQGAVVTAVDINSEDLDICQASNPNIKCVKARAEIMELGEKYDLIFCKDVIEHVPDDKELIANLRRHLEPGGLFILGTHNQWSITNLINGGYHLFFGDIWRGDDPSHVHLYNPYKLSKMLKAAGFQPLASYSTYHWPYLTINMMLVKHELESRIWHGIDELRLNGIFPFNYIGWHRIIVAKAV